MADGRLTATNRLNQIARAQFTIGGIGDEAEHTQSNGIGEDLESNS